MRVKMLTDIVDMPLEVNKTYEVFLENEEHYIIRINGVFYGIWKYEAEIVEELKGLKELENGQLIFNI